MKNSFNRRQFIKRTTSASVIAATHLSGATPGVSIAIDPADKIAAAGPAAWAADHLGETLTARGIRVSRCARPKEAQPGDFCVVSSGFGSPMAQTVLAGAGLALNR